MPANVRFTTVCVVEQCSLSKLMRLQHHLLGTLYQTMFVTPKVIAIFLSKLKTDYFTIASYNHKLYYITYILLCTAPLSYGWGPP